MTKVGEISFPPLETCVCSKKIGCRISLSPLETSIDTYGRLSSLLLIAIKTGMWKLCALRLLAKFIKIKGGRAVGSLPHRVVYQYQRGADISSPLLYAFQDLWGLSSLFFLVICVKTKEGGRWALCPRVVCNKYQSGRDILPPSRDVCVFKENRVSNISLASRDEYRYL